MGFPSLLAFALLALTSAALAAPTNDNELGQSSSNNERGQAVTASKTEGESPNAVASIGDDLAEFGPVTEEQLEVTRRLPIRFNSEKLSALLEQEFGHSSYSDNQVREAIEANDAEKLYDLVKCPICHQCLYSETLATTGCRHAIHEECLYRTYGRCPVCREFPSHGDIHRETLLKKALELFELEGWIPPKPLTRVFAPENGPMNDFMIRFFEEHFRLAEEIIREVRNAISGIHDARNLDDISLLEHLITELRAGSAIPRAIWGVTVFDRSHENIPAIFLESQKRFSLNSLADRILQHLLTEYAARDTRASTVELQIILSRGRGVLRTGYDVTTVADVRSFVDVAPDEVPVGRLYSLVRALSGVPRRIKSLVWGNYESVNAFPAAKYDISESVVSWLHSLEDTVHYILRGTLLELSLEQTISRKFSYLPWLLGFVNDLVRSSIAIKTKSMVKYNAQFMAAQKLYERIAAIGQNELTEQEMEQYFSDEELYFSDEELLEFESSFEELF